MDNNVFTYDQLAEMFRADTTLNEEFKATMLSRFNAIGQAMWNCVNQRDTTMVPVNTYGDSWQEEHNRFVELFQKYHN